MWSKWKYWLAKAILTIVLAFCLGFAKFAPNAGAANQLELRAVDPQTGELVPARMHLRDPRGRPVRQRGAPFWHDHFTFPGKIELNLRPGTYTFALERGLEYRTVSGHFVIEPGAADSKEVEMRRFVDMKQEGWWSGDLYIQRPIADIPLLMQAEDLHVGQVVTWSNEQDAPVSQLRQDPPTVEFDHQRFYHALAGRDSRSGGSLLFLDASQPLPLAAAQPEYPSSAEFLKQAKIHQAHADVARPFSWDMPMWIASGMIDSICVAHDHMLRDGVVDHEDGGRSRDRTFFPPPHGNGRWTMQIYYHLLNCGLRIPPSAGSGSGLVANPVGYNRVYVHCGDRLNYESWWENLRAGRVVVTNGPLIRPTVNGQLPGYVFTAAEGETISLEVALTLSTRDKIHYLEVVKNGEVAHEVRLEEYVEAGGRLPPVEFTSSGWLLVRAVADNQDTFRYAMTGPYYVQIGDQARISRTSAQFFLDWVYDRARSIGIEDPQRRAAVLRYHRAARDFWQERLDAANVP